MCFILFFLVSILHNQIYNILLSNKIKTAVGNCRFGVDYACILIIIDLIPLTVLIYLSNTLP